MLTPCEEGEVEKQEEENRKGYQEREGENSDRNSDGQSKYVFKYRFLHSLKENVAWEELKSNIYL